MNFFRQQLPLAIAFVVGVVMIAQFYIPHPYSREVGERAADWFIIINGIVIYLGIFSLLHSHVNKITRLEAGWAYSGFVFLGMAVMLWAGFLSNGRLEEGTAYKWVYDNTMVPLGATLFSILAFFIASAAFRAFRARSLDATLLLSAAVIVMFCRVPWGEYLAGLVFGPIDGPQGVKKVVQWILEVPNVAATRGIILGVALGVVATSLKIICGIERGYLGDA